MRNPVPTPTSVPSYDVTVYLVFDDFGKLGRAYRETDEEDTELETVIANMLTGQYTNPVRVVAFNTAEGWSRKPASTRAFASFHIGESETVMAENALL
jgi:hypothetical protein